MFQCLRSLLHLTLALCAFAVLPLAGVVKAQPPQPQPAHYLPGSTDLLPPSTFGKSHGPARSGGCNINGNSINGARGGI
jgi:hypothetical protein